MAGNILKENNCCECYSEEQLTCSEKPGKYASNEPIGLYSELVAGHRAGIRDRLAAVAGTEPGWNFKRD